MRLIDADLFKENIRSGLYIFCQENKEDICRAIDDEPTVAVDKEIERKREEIERKKEELYQSSKKLFDTARMLGVERPQGEWIFTNDDYGFWHCNQCKAIGSPNNNFCPNCGADMRGNNNV